MKALRNKLLISALLFSCTTTQVFADSNFSPTLKFDDVIDKSLSLIKESGYKNIDVITRSGSFSGEFINKTEEVLILKMKTGSTNLKAGKEKMQLSLIRLDSIEAISIYILE